MVPRVAQRGHSFKGAGQYYLHDKEAQTSERVAWTHTHNIPTQDPEKAMKWMAYTSMNANMLKQRAGVSMSGRKATTGPVYSFSLAWHPEENPGKETMLGSAMETLDGLGLKDHEAVIVCHQETDHPHVHVICNLVNPDNGKTAVPSYDFLTLSKWAEGHERENGKIYCGERVRNNEKRKQQGKDFGQNKIVKHRAGKLERAEEIQKLYGQSDNGRSFQAALAEAGYTIAKGDRRGFVIVDGKGEIHSLSRQLKGQRARDIKARLSDLGDLPDAKAVSLEIIGSEKSRGGNQTAKPGEKGKLKEQWKTVTPHSKKEAGIDRKAQGTKTQPREDTSPSIEPYYKQLDEVREQEHREQRQKLILEDKLSTFYGREEQAEKIKDLEKQAKDKSNILGRMTGKHNKLKEKLNAEKKSLSNTDQRISEYRSALEKKIEERRMAQFSKGEGADKKHEPKQGGLEKPEEKTRAVPKGKQKGRDLER